MATLLIRNVPDSVRDKLRVRAAKNGRSMEAELRALVDGAVAEEADFAIDPSEPGSARELWFTLRAIAADGGYWDDVPLERLPLRLDRNQS